MKRLTLVIPIFLLAALQAAAPPALAPRGTTALKTFLRTAVDRGDVPGVVAMVVNRDGVLFHDAAGKLNVAGGIDMPKDAIFRIASMTKPVTSVAVMMLVEEGKLKVDDEVSKYLPAFKQRQVLTSVNEATGTFETRPARHPIAIRHLLTHTSGIGYAFSDRRLAIALKKTGAVSEAELPLLHEPGEQWTYGASTRVLGDVVEKISGQRIDAFLESRIAKPLGMNDTTFTVPRAKYARVVTAHQKENGKTTEDQNPETIPATIRGDGGLFSTASDYGLFVRMLLNEGQLGATRLLSAQTIREMTKNQMGSVVVHQQPTADPRRSNPFPLGAGEDTWGFGFQIAAPKSRSPNMRSPGSYNWAGIHNTFFWVDPEKQIGVIVLMQVLPFYDDQAIQLLRGVEELVYRHLR